MSATPATAGVPPGVSAALLPYYKQATSGNAPIIYKCRTCKAFASSVVFDPKLMDGLMSCLQLSCEHLQCRCRSWFVCLQCQMKFERREAAKKHKQKHHSKPDPGFKIHAVTHTPLPVYQ